MYMPSVSGHRNSMGLSTLYTGAGTAWVCLQGATSAGSTNSRMYPDSGRAVAATAGTGTYINAIKIG